MHRYSEFVVVGLLISAAVSAGCNTSPVTPTPVVPPEIADVSMAVTGVSPARGLGGDRIRITGTGFMAGVMVTLGGVAANVTTTNATSITALVPVHATGAADVVVINPSGLRASLTGGFTFESVSLTAMPTVAAPGGQLSVNWSAPPGRSCNGGGDWVALYRVGEPPYLWFTHLCGGTSGSSALTAPTRPGQYEFRYMVEDIAVARSSPVTVTAAASP